MDTKEFIEKSKKIHGDKYDYSKSIYVKSKIKLTIICPIHGEFFMAPQSHLYGKNGCQKCAKIKGLQNLINNSNKKRITFESFLERAKNIHNNKYEYEKIEIKNFYQKVRIKCPVHGWFIQSVADHLRKHGCIECHRPNRGSSQRLLLGEFIEKANNIHNNIYDYSKVVYTNNHTKIIIGCKTHGDFQQTPASHLKSNGCPICKSSKGEIKIKEFLEKRNILFKQQKTFSGCKNKQLLQFDFYLPDLNSCIEYDGMQHFKAIEYFGGEKGLIETKKRDIIKNEYCKQNNISLLRIKYNEKIENKITSFLKTFF